MVLIQILMQDFKKISIQLRFLNRALMLKGLGRLGIKILDLE